MLYRIEIDYYDEYLGEEKTYSYQYECNTEDEAYESWSYGEDIVSDTVTDVRVIKLKEDQKEKVNHT